METLKITQEEVTQLDMMKSEMVRMVEELQSLTKTIDTVIDNIRKRQNGVFTEQEIRKSAETLLKKDDGQ